MDLWDHVINMALDSVLRAGNRAGAAGQTTFSLKQLTWDSACPSSHMWNLMVPKERK